MTVQDLTDNAADVAAFSQAWREWHAQHEKVLADPHGFLAITSLHWLTETPQRFDDAPGSWSTGADGVVVVLDDNQDVVIAGNSVRGEYRFGRIPERGGVNVVWGDAVIEVAKRGGFDIVRPRHPENALRVAFTGTPAFTPDSRWALPARYV